MYRTSPPRTNNINSKWVNHQQQQGPSPYGPSHHPHPGSSTVMHNNHNHNQGAGNADNNEDMRRRLVQLEKEVTRIPALEERIRKLEEELGRVLLQANNNGPTSAGSGNGARSDSPVRGGSPFGGHFNEQGLYVPKANPNVRFCELCQVEYQVRIADEHFRGKRHRQMEAKLREEGAWSQLDAANSNGGRSSPPPPEQDHRNRVVGRSPSPTTSGHSNNGAMTFGGQMTSSGYVPKLDPNVRFCELCQCEYMLGNADRHFQGKRHLQVEAKLRAEGALTGMNGRPPSGPHSGPPFPQPAHHGPGPLPSPKAQPHQPLPFGLQPQQLGNNGAAQPPMNMHPHAHHTPHHHHQAPPPPQGPGGFGGRGGSPPRFDHPRW